MAFRDSSSSSRTPHLKELLGGPWGDLSSKQLPEEQQPEPRDFEKDDQLQSERRSESRDAQREVDKSLKLLAGKYGSARDCRAWPSKGGPVEGPMILRSRSSIIN